METGTTWKRHAKLEQAGNYISRRPLKAQKEKMLSHRAGKTQRVFKSFCLFCCVKKSEKKSEKKKRKKEKKSEKSRILPNIPGRCTFGLSCTFASIESLVQC